MDLMDIVMSPNYQPPRSGRAPRRLIRAPESTLTGVRWFPVELESSPEPEPELEPEFDSEFEALAAAARELEELRTIRRRRSRFVLN